jgi:2-alkyl-3-oxoalkanoate reductase
MNIFIAGGSGAIGRPLILELVRRGHRVTGMSRSEAGKKSFRDLGASVVDLNVFDAGAVTQTLRKSQPEVVIDELTALPKDPADFQSAAAGDRKLRLEGGANLHRAAQAAGAGRYIQQLSGFFLKASTELADESSPLATDATPGVARSAQSYSELEARLAQSGKMEAVGLRYGFFYGPGTWYSPDGACAQHVRQKHTPIIGQGQGVWSWIHIDDAAMATVAAVTAPPGIYNIVDDDPSPMSRWLPAFARSVGAPPPPQVSEEEAAATAGEDAVFYGTRLCGASNRKAKQTFGFRPRPLEWLDGGS